MSVLSLHIESTDSMNNQWGLRCSNPFKSSPGSHSLLVSDSVGLLGSGVSALGQPHVVASTLPLLLGIYLELVTALDYS